MMTHTINPSSFNYVVSAGLSSKPTTGRMVLPKSRSLVTTKQQPQWQLVLSATDIYHTTTSTSVAASSFHISPPPIDQDIPDTLADEDVNPTLDDNDEEALNAFYNGVAVVNLSDFGRIRVSGDDRIQFLQNQTTADFGCLSEGQGMDTVFITPTARTIDIAHAWVTKNAITLMVSPGTCESITSMLTKVLVENGCLPTSKEISKSKTSLYIFFADKVEIHDFTKETCFFVLVGPKSSQVMNSLNLGDLVGKPYGTHLHYNVNGLPITVGVGSIISEDGFSMLVSAAAAESVWNTLLAQGAIPMGSDAWERLRIYEGRPAPGKELTQEFNVLEAGFWNSISLKKGCYKGQETIARLVTYDGVKQKLWGLRLSAPAEPGSPITVDGKKAGMLTSYAPGNKEFKHVGLGYIKTKAASEGHTVTVGNNILGEVVDVPFLKRQRR